MNVYDLFHRELNAGGHVAYLKLVMAALVLSTGAIGPTPVRAQTPPSPQVETEVKAAWAAAGKTAIFGPADVKLPDKAGLKLASDQVFIPAAEANRIMVAIGNPSSPSRQGLIVSDKDDAPWMVDVGWIKEGYIRDGDAKEWESDAMLEALKQATEADNSDRLARGLPALDVIGWVEKPGYDPANHRLVWSLALRERGAPANLPQTINYNSYALGREGYFSLDLITGSDRIAADKQVARDLLRSLRFAPGKRYQDFKPSSDKVAAYGLGALIGVVAAKKLGLLALVGFFLLKVWKLGLVALAVAGAALRRFFQGRRPPDADA